jgi:hypothetical protein
MLENTSAAGTLAYPYDQINHRGLFFIQTGFSDSDWGYE